MTQQNDPGALVAAQYDIPRSPEWPRVEREHLSLQPSCAACGYSGPGLQVHHVLPFHFCVKLGRPDLELDERNLMTLCGETVQDHHLLLGHLNNWQSYNPTVRADIISPFQGMLAALIKENSQWLASVKQRPPILEAMTPQQIADFQQLMNTLYPLQEQSAS